MEIEIRKLSPKLAGDYVRFFDTTPHDDGVDDHKCYCIGFSSADHRMSDNPASRETRQKIAFEYVSKGMIQGYLAYAEGRIVGWCNANTKSECLHCGGYLWMTSSASGDAFTSDPEDKVKAIYCFTVAPEMKRKGIAKRLLQYACEDAAENGFDYVEAYPEKEIVNELDHFMGFVDMYQSLGFVIHGEIEKKYVMRKQLK